MKSVFQFGVDNILCHAADPTFVGFCAARDADCASKTVAKASAHEPVGVVALADGAPAVVEYSEISREMAEATGPDGRLLYGSAHICVNYFSMSFLRTFSNENRDFSAGIACPAVSSTLTIVLVVTVVSVATL